MRLAGRASAVALLVALGSVGAARAALGIERCSVQPSPPERTACLIPFLAAPETEGRAISALEKLLDEDPQGVERAAASGASRAGSADPSLRARLFALQGRALLKLGKSEDAVQALSRANEIDDGTSGLRWLTSDGAPSWTRPIDGGGRLEWTARALLAAGKTEEARGVLARAIALGAGGWPLEEGWKAAGGEEVPGVDSPPAPVLVPRWFDPLPPLTVRLLDGGELRFDSARGSVLLLDFWASWCGPCMQELPHMKELFAAERQHGLTAVAVNAQEPVRIAREAAKSLALGVPIALYDDALDRQFGVRTLPTVIAVDRQGRIRARWDGYLPGLETTIAETVHGLLGDDPEGAPRKVGDSIVGGKRFTVAWSRDFRSPVGGVAFLPERGGKPKIAVTAEGQILTLDADGAIAKRGNAPSSAGRLFAVDLDRDGRAEVIAFRPAATEIVVFDLAQGVYRTWTARAPVLDVAYLGARPEAGQGRIVLATTDGPQLVDTRGIESIPAEGPSPATAVGVVGAEGAQEIVVLGGKGDLRWLDPTGKAKRRASVPADAFRLVTDADPRDGAGVAPPSVVAETTGSFLGRGGSRQAALATSGQLVIVDVADGSVVARLRWPGITDLAAGDLDGDGVDDLIVVWGRSIAVLRARGAADPR